MFTDETATYAINQLYAARVVATGGKCMLALITRSQSSKHAVLQGDPTMSLIVPVVSKIWVCYFTAGVRGIAASRSTVRCDSSTMANHTLLHNKASNYLLSLIIPVVSKIWVNSFTQ